LTVTTSVKVKTLLQGLSVITKAPPTSVQVAQLYNYKYDQLNRITSMDVFRGFNEATNTWSSMSSTTDYRERISYDANGNILKYLRNGISSISSNMDSLTYFYYSGTNRLKYVRDNVADNIYTNSSHGVEDINNQTNTSNYTYSEIGNLEKDLKDSIKLIKWNVYGKIVEIQRTASSTRPITNIKYTYDAAGNRISKRVVNNQNNKAEYTWYVRDAQGNVMATYFGSGQASTTLFSSNYNLTVTDQHIYGSSRVGVFNRNFDVKTAYVRPSIIIFERGLKMHELSNHLGNVLVTISDKKLQHQSTVNTTLVDYYVADVVTANDYYPGGMVMPGRSYSSTSKYRYSFNGQELSNEIYGENNAFDFGNRIYSPRLCKWLSVDKLFKKYSGESPYLFTSGNPIYFADPDGNDKIVRTRSIGKDGTTVIKTVVFKDVFKVVTNASYNGGYYFTKNDFVVDITHDYRTGKEIVSTSTQTLYGPGHATEISGKEALSVFFTFKGKEAPPSTQVIIFGSGLSDPGWGDKADPTKSIYAIDLGTFNSIMSMITTGASVPDLKSADPAKWADLADKARKQIEYSKNPKTVIKTKDSYTEEILVDNISKLGPNVWHTDPINIKKIRRDGEGRAVDTVTIYNQDLFGNRNPDTNKTVTKLPQKIN
jgi:RHS repeat-associated protein